MKITMHFDDDGLEDDLTRAGASARSLLSKAVYATGGLLQTEVRANASSATHPNRESARRGHMPGTGPGPNVATGNYRRSIQHTPTIEAGEPVSYIHSNAAQARRLEYGFVGVDSLGRSYSQPAYPHWQPAAEKAGGILEAQAARVLDQLLNDLGGKK